MPGDHPGSRSVSGSDGAGTTAGAAAGARASLVTTSIAWVSSNDGMTGRPAARSTVSRCRALTAVAATATSRATGTSRTSAAR